MVTRHIRKHVVHIRPMGEESGKMQLYSIEIINPKGEVIHKEDNLRGHKNCLSNAAYFIEAQKN